MKKKKQLGHKRLLEMVMDFINKHGRDPFPTEMPVRPKTIAYHFGSFSEMIRLAHIGLEALGSRRIKKVRYCRHCKKKLPPWRWFFHDGCDILYMEKQEKEPDPIYHEPLKSKYLSMCEYCDKDCKIKIPAKQNEKKLSFKIICQKYPNGKQN